MKDKQEWGVQIQFLNTIFLPLLIFTFLQMKNLQFDNWQQTLSSITSVVTIILVVFYMIFLYRFIKKFD